MMNMIEQMTVVTDWFSFGLRRAINAFRNVSQRWRCSSLAAQIYAEGNWEPKQSEAT